MRNLTQTEIDNAPDWATHYFTYNNDKQVRWQDNIKHIFMWSHEGKINTFPRDNHKHGEPIPRKELDEFRKENREIARGLLRLLKRF